MEDFLDLPHQLNFPDNCLCSFLFMGLNIVTKAQLSGEGPRGSFIENVELVLVSCGLSLTVGPADDDTSPTPDPVPSQIPSHCEKQQHEPTTNNESESECLSRDA